MRTIILTKGIQASGKSTWALEQLREHPGRFKRFNRDSMRRMLDNDEYSPENAKFVVKLRNSFIEYALSRGYDVILDDMNFKDRNFLEVCDIARIIGNVQVVEKYFEIDLKTALARNAKREKPIPEHVIRDAFDRYVKNKRIEKRTEYFPPNIKSFEPQKDKEDAIIVDVDGTLALNYGGRDQFDLSRVGEDTLEQNISNLIDIFVLTRSYKILIVSGRDDCNLEETRKWLREKGVTFDLIYMRKTGDRRTDWVVKKEIYESDISPYYNIFYVVDDRGSVVRMWRSLGLTVLQLDDTNF